LKVLRWLHVACGLMALAWAAVGVWAATHGVFPEPSPGTTMALYGAFCTGVCAFCTISLRSRRRLRAVKWLSLGLVLFLPMGTVVGLMTFLTLVPEDSHPITVDSL
jgi:hypothetical protein